jgi:mannose-6-phosphate isomerase-like protein (cupin superfamily)
MDVVNLDAELAAVPNHWNPRTVARYNDFLLRVVRFRYEFVWHKHDDTDELFLVLAGTLTLQFRERAVLVHPGELCVVPRGIEHCPRADEEVAALLLEPAAGCQRSSSRTDCC